MTRIAINSTHWQNREDRYWSVFFNSLSGPRPAVMLGTHDDHRVSNLALFNSVVHVGANPPLLGFVLRPTTVERHSWQNINLNKHYTFNYFNETQISKAHQSAAKYPAEVDEFEAIGIEKVHIEGVNAPFVKDATIRVGLEFREALKIKCNGCRFVVGEVIYVDFDQAILMEDGLLRHDEAETILVSGLDAYHTQQLIKRMPYARP